MAQFVRTVIIILTLLKCGACATNNTSATRTDYCNMESCRGAPHIGCGNSGRPSCSEFVPLDYNEKLIQATLDKHNELRNKIAYEHNTLGLNNEIFPTASDMCFMNWDNELAYLASLNVLQCEIKHDECRDVDRFISGQNLYLEFGLGLAPVINQTFIETGIQSFFDEHVDCPVSEVGNLQLQSEKKIGHFTQMIRGESALIGCAAANFYDPNFFPSGLLCCNYQHGNVLTTPIYTVGEPCSACPNQLACNDKYKGLCGSQNKVDSAAGSQNAGSANDNYSWIVIVMWLIFFVFETHKN